VSDLWREKVAPALLELAELERERRIRSLLRSSILSNPSTRAIEAGIGALSFSADALPGLIAAATAAAVETAAAGYRRAQEIETKRSSNQFGFLFAADKTLLKR
jgi:hypothetical protein